MKQIVLLMTIACVLLSSNVSFSQFANLKFAEEVPNYILAKNSDFIVQILTTEGILGGDRFISFGGIGGGTTYTKVEHIELGQKMIDTICKLVTERFKKINMTPAGYVALNANNVGDISKVEEIFETYAKNKPGFTFFITIITSDIDEIKKAYEKGKLTLDIIKPATISIQRIGETDPSKTFVLVKKNISLEERFVELEKSIKEKPTSYFLQTMQKEELSNFKYDSVFYKKILTEKKAINSWPDEKELASNKVLVLSCGNGKDKYYEHSIKMLEKFYPYKYDIVTTEDKYDEYIKNGYKYVFIAKADAYVKASSLYLGGGASETKASLVNWFYYVVKNMETLDVYYGTDRKKLEENRSESPSWGLRATLKFMKEYYKWPDKQK